MPPLPAHLQSLPGGANPSLTGLTPGNAPKPHLVSGPGGSLFDLLQADRYQTFSRITRKRGNATLYAPELAPGNPYQFTLMQFKAPNELALIITNYRLELFRYSGIHAGLAVRVEGDELTDYLGVKFTIGSQGVPWDLQNEVTAAPATIQNAAAVVPPNPTFGGGPVLSPSGFATAFAGSSVAVSNVGSAILPLTADRVGDDEGPFSLYASRGDQITLTMFCFRPLPYPISFFQAKIAGYTLSDTEMQRLRTQLTP